MKKNKSVHTIDLRGCPLSDYGCHAFAGIFKHRMKNANKQKKANSIKQLHCDWDKLEKRRMCFIIKSWHEYVNFQFKIIVDGGDGEEECS